MSDLPPCDREIFENGTALLWADTWTRAGWGDDDADPLPPRAAGFEAWIVKIREVSGGRIDWHYSGGRAQVLYLGDVAPIFAAIEAHPCPAEMRFFEEGQELLRARGGAR